MEAVAVPWLGRCRGGAGALVSVKPLEPGVPLLTSCPHQDKRAATPQWVPFPLRKRGLRLTESHSLEGLA